VGKARDLRARLRSYFHSQRQRPAVESALDQVERIEWRVLGSELAASLEEIALIRRLRPPANRRTPMPERYVYLHQRGERIVLSRAPSRYGPLRRRADAQRAARALRGCAPEEVQALLGGARPERLRREVVELVECRRELDARRLSGLIASLERVAGEIERIERIRRLSACLLAPGLEPGTREAYVVHEAKLTLRDTPPFEPPPGDPAPIVEADELDGLLVFASFLDAPPPELKAIRLESRGRVA